MHKKILPSLLTTILFATTCNSFANTTLTIHCKGNLCNGGTDTPGSVFIDTTLSDQNCQFTPKKGTSTWSIPDNCLLNNNIVNVGIAQPGAWVINFNPKYKDRTFSPRRGSMKIASLDISAYQHIIGVFHHFKVKANYK